MPKHTRRTVWREIVWRPSVAAVGLFFTIVPILTWIRDEFMPAAMQERLKIPRLLPHWHWWVWALAGLSLLVFTIGESAYRLVRKHEGEYEKELDGLRGQLERQERSSKNEIQDLRLQLEKALATKPLISSEFRYVQQQAFFSVTNKGTIAKVWASLRVRGMVKRPGVGPYARWNNSRAFKIEIAKGETHDLPLATLRLQDVSFPISTWVVHYATEDDVGMAEASESSLVMQKDDGQASPIDLYIKLFSDPECADLNKELHVILRPHRAELCD